MGLIVDHSDVKAHFVREWRRFLPAIISYGKTCTDKRIKEILCSLTDGGECSEWAWVISNTPLLQQFR